jgi:hypothetical protein
MQATRGMYTLVCVCGGSDVAMQMFASWYRYCFTIWISALQGRYEFKLSSMNLLYTLILKPNFITFLILYYFRYIAFISM